jgi:osmotically-inducible protein OsmY
MSEVRVERKHLFAAVLAVVLIAPAAVRATEPDARGAESVQPVTDSAIAAAVRTRLTANQAVSVTNLEVDTEQGGIVWLSGVTQTQEAADRAVEMVRNIDGVSWVKSTIVVSPATR